MWKRCRKPVATILTLAPFILIATVSVARADAT